MTEVRQGPTPRVRFRGVHFSEVSILARCPLRVDCSLHLELKCYALVKFLRDVKSTPFNECTFKSVSTSASKLTFAVGLLYRGQSVDFTDAQMKLFSPVTRY